MKKKRKKKDKKKDTSSKSKRKHKEGDARIENAIEKAAGGGAASNSKWKHGDWSCQKCGAHNFRGKDSCFRCKYPRANSVKAASAESALAYLTERRSGAREMDSVQHLWLGKNVYNRDVNDATFDLYVDTYVGTLEDKHKLQILKRARLAAARAARLVEALGDTPEESPDDGKAPSSGKKRRKKSAKKPENGGARTATTAEKTPEKKKAPEPSRGEAKEKEKEKGKAKEKEKEKEKENAVKTKKTPSAVAKKEAKTTELSAKRAPKKESAAKRKASSSAAEAPPARVTRSRAAKK